MKEGSRKGAEAQREGAETFAWPSHGITCFHCGDHFSRPEAAALHFGETPLEQPGCVLKLTWGDNGLLAWGRSLQAELDRYRKEDQPIMRELYALGAKHARELREAEQIGYDRGLIDGRSLLASAPLPAVVARAVADDLAHGMSLRQVAEKHGVSFGKVRGVARKALCASASMPAPDRDPVRETQ